MAGDEHVVALGLLTTHDLDKLGASFRRFYPIEDVPCFGELLLAIDEADRALRRRRDADPE